MISQVWHRVMLYGGALAIALANFLPAIRAEEIEAQCSKSATFLAPIDSPEYRKYAPDREIDILHLALDVTPDFQKRTISGGATLQFKPIAKPLSELRLDGVDLVVSEVVAGEKIESFQVTDKQVIVTFAQPIRVDQETAVTIKYSAEPNEGLYFRTPEMGYKTGDTHLFTQGEAIEARHWYPCYDSPNEKFTSEVVCHVPEGMTVLSNGKKLSEEKDANGLIAIRWLQDKPHVSYLISLVAGHFKKIEDRYKDIPLAFHTPPSDIKEASNSFQGTKEMMAYFEQEIGIPYPWAKYDQVVVHDFVAGGMENTSITTLTQYTLHTAAFEELQSSEGLVAHELAHQWFGDLVTCKDWSHVWLNEGFATFYAHLFAGHKHGRDELLFGLFNDADIILRQTNDTRSIVFRKYDSPNDQFSYLAYPKGAWVLHMLRSQLGDDLYRRCIKTYLERHQFGNVVTDDLNQVVEELSGRSYDQFFDQWVYHAHYPELEVNYSWDAQAKVAKVSVAQTQKISEEVLLFKFPLTIRFKSKRAAADRSIIVKEKSEDFYFPLAEAPELVRVDPEYALLAKIKFNVPEPMLRAQIDDREDVIGRLLAVKQLSQKKDRASVDRLKNALKSDSFYGVRADAAKALRSIHSDDALLALLDGMDQRDARVRQQVVLALAGFYDERAYQALLRTLEREKNPEIVADAVGGLAAYGKPDVRQSLVRFLKSDSYQNRVAEAAARALRSQDDPSLIEPLQSTLRERQTGFTTRGLGQGLEALASLARNETNKDAVREFLTPFTADKRRAVRIAVIRALGGLGDAKAIPVLETFAQAGKLTPEQSPAENAVASLRAGRKSADEWKDLRNEVLELKKQNRDLRHDVDDLKKKLEAASGPGTAKPSKPTKSKSK